MSMSNDNELRTSLDSLQQYEVMVNALRAQLAARDERIAVLEDKIVHMSLELASSKASEDRRTRRRRTSVEQRDARIVVLENKIVDMSLELASSKASEDRHRTTRYAASASGDGGEEASSPVPRRTRKVSASFARPRRKSLIGALGSSIRSSMNWGDAVCPVVDDETHASLPERLSSDANLVEPFSSSSEVDSYSRGISANFGKLFRKNRVSLEERTVTTEEHSEGHAISMMSAEFNMSLMSLEGVVFPTSDEDIWTKGCRERRESLGSQRPAMR